MFKELITAVVDKIRLYIITTHIYEDPQKPLTFKL